MRNILILCFFCLASQTVFSQTAPRKYWVQFTDKDNSEYSISEPEEFLSEASIARRAKFNIPITEQDLPVKAEYINWISSMEGVRVKHASKWFNAVTIVLADSVALENSLPLILSSNAVSQVKGVQVYVEDNKIEKDSRKALQRIPLHDGTEYGKSADQIYIHNGQLLHELGYQGEGMKIAQFDSGYSGIGELAVFERLRSEGRIKLTLDIVDGDETIENAGTHGRSVLSIMGGHLENDFIGSAPGADYYLFKTERGSSEFVTEEDNWVRALEIADSIGVDMVNSSLGYTIFDDTLQNHTYGNMNGNTTRISIAADIGASKGILVVNSAGNSGNKPWKFIGAPADADSILAVGAVNSLGERAPFSSYGPSSDGDVKPNVTGVGWGTAYANSSGGVSFGDGTSFSAPVITGLTACLWQAFPDKSNMEIIDAIQRSSSVYTSPNDSLGYGIPDFYKAFTFLLTSSDYETDKVLFYPNPFSAQIALLLESTEVDRIEILNHLGQLVQEIDGFVESEKATSVDLSEYFFSKPSGEYFIRIYSEEELLKTKKLIKLSN